MGTLAAVQPLAPKILSGRRRAGCVGVGADEGGLSAKFSSCTRAAPADDACELVRKLVCDVHFI
jgi:hypothetical protein